MKLRTVAVRLIAAGIGVLAFAGIAGVARAQADPSPPPTPSIIDQLITLTPALTVDPLDEGGRGAEWDGVGMFCQNLWVRCR